MEVAKVSEFDSRAQYWSNGRDRSYDSAGRSSPRSSPRSGRKYYGNSSEERDTSRYGTQGRECNKDSGSRKYRNNSKERYVSRYRENCRESSRDRVCYNCRGSGHEMRSCPSIKCFSCGRRGHVSRYYGDKGREVRYGSRDSCRERYWGRESPHDVRDKWNRPRDYSMNKYERDGWFEKREMDTHDEGYSDNSRGKSARFAGYRHKYGEDQ
ncbi:uncharacterized protein [Watersipora subatra]|uniref:uncharacterized protein n=1 Tax=Watersipora subatra TaxID=2589382 RepID=UPI00355C570D